MGCNCQKCKKEDINEEKDLRQIENGMNNQTTEQKYIEFNSKDSGNNTSRTPLTVRNFKHYAPKYQKELSNMNYITNNLSFSLYEIINKIRANPKCFIDKIKSYKDKIIKKDYQFLLPIAKEIFITLNRGPKAFDEAIEFLNKIEPMNSLIIKNELKINIEDNINENFDEMTFTSFSFLEKIIKSKKKELEKNKKKFKIEGFHYDKSTDNAEISAILQIVDDNMGDYSRRKNLLNPNITYIGISVVNIKESVFCYYMLFANTKN